MLQKRLDEVSGELRKTQTSYKSLLADAEKAKGQQQSIAGENIGSVQGELWSRPRAFGAGCSVGQGDSGLSEDAWYQCEQDTGLVHAHMDATPVPLSWAVQHPCPLKNIHGQGFFGQ